MVKKKKVNTIIPVWRGLVGEGGSILTTTDESKARRYYKKLAEELELEINEEGFVEEDGHFTYIYWYITELVD